MSNFTAYHDTITHQIGVLLDRVTASEQRTSQSTLSSDRNSTGPQAMIMEDAMIISNGLEHGNGTAKSIETEPEATHARIPSDVMGNDPSLQASRPFLLGSETCSIRCSCICHNRITFRSPSILDQLFGEFCVLYKGQRRVQCTCPNTSSFHVIYKFPAYLLYRYISLAVQLNQVAGPELLLRVPQVLTPEHTLWHHSVIGDTNAVRRMYSEGLASPYDVSIKGTPAIFKATDHKSPDFAFYLLDQGADFDISNNAGITAAERLWDQAYEGACGAKGSAVVRKLSPGDDRVADMGFATLHKVVLGFIHKDIATVLNAIEDMIDAVDFRRRKVLYWVVLCDDVAAVRTLLAAGAEPNVPDRQGLVAIDAVRSVSVCRMLLKAEANINNPVPVSRRYALQHAVIRCAPVEVIDTLIAAGSDVNYRDIDQESALAIAIYWGFTEIVVHLIQAGAEVNISNKSSTDHPIHFAAAFNRWDILPLLLGRGADYTALNKYKRDLGHTAALFASTEFIKVMRG